MIEDLLKVRGRRILGIDYGERYIGFAISDIQWLLSTPLSPVDSYNCNIIQHIGILMNDHNVGGVVLGYPINMNGSIGPACEKTEQFLDNLKKVYTEMPTVLWDERLTTALAEKSMIESNLSRAKRKKKVDSLAASYILQSALDALCIKKNDYKTAANGDQA